jgi:hypothetical protein
MDEEVLKEEGEDEQRDGDGAQVGAQSNED